MTQTLLPLVPNGATPISDDLSVVNENGQWTYFAGAFPVFSHPVEDRNSFRMFAVYCWRVASSIASATARIVTSPGSSSEVPSRTSSCRSHDAITNPEKPETYDGLSAIQTPPRFFPVSSLGDNPA